MYVFANLSGPIILLLLAVALATGVLLMRLHRHRGRRSRNLPTIVRTARPGPDKNVRLGETPREVGQWEVQMHELARDLSARLDSKMGLLQHLVRDAEQAASRLETVLRELGAQDPHALEDRKRTTSGEFTTVDPPDE